MARYSLADYILTITLPTEFASDLQLASNTISVGGEGSHTESINISTDNNIWTTEGDATGSWVHSKNLNRVGKASVSLSQLSENVAKFKKICNVYYTSGTDYDGITLSLTDSLGNNIATCNDCYFTKVPSQDFGNTAANQTWELTCGQITFNE